MGYTTEFQGHFSLNKQLKPEHSAYLFKFAESRRMKRNAQKAATLPDPLREAVGLPIGVEGEYFVGVDNGGFLVESEDNCIVEHNDPPSTQPGLWCQWVPTIDGNGIKWDQGEKFYDYVEWLQYLIAHFLIPWGYKLSGKVSWRGEDFKDNGIITVKNNKINTKSK